MQTKWIIPAVLTGFLGLGIAQADDHGYQHSHSGSEQARNNTDVNFGNPADVKRADHTVKFELSANGAVSQQHLAIKANDTIRFNLRNDSSQMAAFVIGDEAVLREFSRAYQANPQIASGDFHAVPVAAGQSQKFGWKFNTFGTKTVYAAYVTSDGEYAGKMVMIHAGTERNR